MAALRAKTSAINLARANFCRALHSRISFQLIRSSSLAGSDGALWGMPCATRCASTKSGGGGSNSLARKAEVQRLLYQAVERYKSDGDVEPIPRITLDHVTISYANSGQGGPNANKVSSKVEMRFNVKNANWLNDRVRERIMQMEKNRINKDGEIVITSAKTRAQKTNIEDAVAKLQVFNYQKKKLQAIIDSASYVPPPPPKDTLKKIAILSALGEQKQKEKKKAELQKKVVRRN